MGITNFHKMIKENYSNAFQKKWLDNYDNVYVDLNYVLHYCSYSSHSEDDVFTKLYAFFDCILAELIPTKSLTICSDGVAPLAKLILQRQRRLNVSKNIDSEKTTNDFSTMLFTPGTAFMKNLNNKLTNYFNYVSNTFNITINYLDSTFDEAELKLKFKLMENINQNKMHSHIVVTNDADVIVMLTTLQYLDNTFVFCRSNQQNEILSIGKLIDLHTDKVGCSLNPNYDFALVSIMMGNDYIPKIKLVDFEKLWEAYANVLMSNSNGLVNLDLTINDTFFVKMLNQIIYLSKQTYPNTVNVYNAFSDLYSNYLDGLTWCLHTYQSGKCIRYNYMYEYQDAPHPLGLIFNIIQNKNLLKFNKTISPAITPELYAILVLPDFARNLIDKKYHKFMNQNDILYTTEKCKKCAEFHDELKTIKNNIAKTQAEIDSDNEDNSDIQKKLQKIKNQNTLLSKQLIAHKKNHDKLTLSDITTIVTNFNIFCQNC